MRVLCVFSGGLDSMLSAALVRAQGLDVLGLVFETPFFTPEKALASAALLDLPLRVLDITARHLETVRAPRHGYGAGMNPCMDCHALMFRIAGEMLEAEGAAFLITGEVLGQRPLSQNRAALSLVARESGIPDLLLRPLSAQHLPPTLPETRGWIQRESLLDFQGRSRKPQMALARELGIHRYPAPGGGCLLTDRNFSRRLRDLLDSSPSVARRDLELLTWGRHFRLGPETRATVGRDRRENEAIRRLAGPQDTLLRPRSVPGPHVLLTGPVSPALEALAAELLAAYSDAAAGERVEILSSSPGGERVLSCIAGEKDAFRTYLI